VSRLILRRARLLDQLVECDVRIENGRVAEVAPSIAAGTDQEIDLAGRLLLPAFVDSHVHLDKAFLWESPLIHGTVGPAFFAALRDFKATAEKAEIKARMRRALELAASHGTTALRAQIDVDDGIGLAGLEAALELREERSAVLRLQLVAFPQHGLLGKPGLMTLMRAALTAGADAVGAGPSFDSVPPAVHLRAVFDLAAELDRDVDLHVDLATTAETPPEEWELVHVARLTRERGWQGRVTVAHLRPLGAMPPERAEPILELLREAGIAVTVVPGAELGAARTWWDPPTRDVTRAVTNVEALIRAGVAVSYSTGHVCDPWNPYGNADMLRDGLLLAAAYNLGETSIGSQPILRLGTETPWRSMGLPGPAEVAEGRIADLVVLDAPDAATALRHQAERLYVFKDGESTLRRQTTTWLAGRAD
jgi:cytosine deaminase